MAATDPAIAASATADVHEGADAATSSLLERHGLSLALAAAWIATLGSLYFSEVRGYAPCRCAGTSGS